MNGAACVRQLADVGEERQPGEQHRRACPSPLAATVTIR